MHRFTSVLLLFTTAAHACSISHLDVLWAKKPGAGSKLFAFERNGRVGFIDQTGRIAIQPTIEVSIDAVGDFSNGLARVGDRGYIDTTGRWVIKGAYRWTEDFSEGLALVETDSPDRYPGSAMYIDTQGRPVTSVPPSRTEAFAEGLAAYESPGRPAIRSLQPGNIQYRDFPGLKGFINRNGKLVIQPLFADVGPFVGGLARAVVDGYCHIAMPDGSVQGTPTTGYPSSCGGAPADATTPCSVGFIDRSGEFALATHFESARDFSEALAAVRKNGLWGFIDARGHFRIEPRFEQAQSFREGVAAVRINDRCGFVDTTGRLVIAPQFERVDPFSESLAVAWDNGVPFYIDRQGKTRIRGAFRAASPFVHGLAAVLLDERHVAYINQAGKIVFEYFRKQ